MEKDQDMQEAPVIVRDLLTKEVRLVLRPKGLPKESDFEVITLEFVYTRPPPSGQVVLKTLWFSVDPYLRELLNEDSGIHGVRSFDLDKPIRAESVSKVIASNSPGFDEGDIVYGNTIVSNYINHPHAARTLRVIESRPHIPLTHYLGVLGMPGLTAWVGVNIIVQLKPGEHIFVSAASGAVGQLVGQLAKLKGCRVVGSAGSEMKVNILKEGFQFDDAFNYKEEQNLELALRRCFPNGFDVYYENVGGKMLEAVLEVINPRGRIAACGMVSQYNKEAHEHDGVTNLFHIVGKSLRMEGFLVFHYHDKWDVFEAELIPLLQEGKISYKVDILGRGVEEFPKALIRLLKGENIGKAVVYVSDE